MSEDEQLAGADYTGVAAPRAVRVIRATPLTSPTAGQSTGPHTCRCHCGRWVALDTDGAGDVVELDPSTYRRHTCPAPPSGRALAMASADHFSGSPR